MKRKVKITVFSLVTAAALVSAALSVYTEVKYFSTKIVWQCLVGAVWTIASIVAALLGTVNIFNAHFDTEKRVVKTYRDIDGNEERTFYYRKSAIAADALKTFLTSTELPEKICLLSDAEKYCVLDETMNPLAARRKFDLGTKQYEYRGQIYTDADEIFERLRADGFIGADGNAVVIDYEYSTPTHLIKLICGKTE